MKTPKEGNTGRPFSKVTEEGWPEKRKALMKRLSRDRSRLKLDKENLTAERKRLATEVESLEEENHAIAKRAKDLQIELLKKRTTAKESFESSDESNKRLVGPLARERGLLNEIGFFETEKARLSGTYLEVSGRLGANVSELDRTLRDIGFMNGEVRALMEKMEMLEGEVPMKFKDVDNLDEKISASIKALRSLYNRMQGTERDVKISYYKNKKGTRE